MAWVNAMDGRSKEAEWDSIQHLEIVWPMLYPFHPSAKVLASHGIHLSTASSLSLLNLPLLSCDLCQTQSVALWRTLCWVTPAWFQEVSSLAIQNCIEFWNLSSTSWAQWIKVSWCLYMYIYVRGILSRYKCSRQTSLMTLADIMLHRQCSWRTALNPLMYRCRTV